MMSVRERLRQNISAAFYRHGLLCASYPVPIILFTSASILACCVLSDQCDRVSVRVFAVSRRSGLLHPAGVLVKAAVSPWDSSLVAVECGRFFPVSGAKVANRRSRKVGVWRLFVFRDGADGWHCLRAGQWSQLRRMQSVLPEHGCLLVSPGNYWQNRRDLYSSKDSDPDILKTIQQHEPKGLTSPQTGTKPADDPPSQQAPEHSGHLLFGVPGKSTGVSLYSKKRVVTYTITIAFSTYDSREIFPYLVVVIGIENVLVLTKSVVSTPVDLEEFCLFAVVGLVSDFFLQMFFFTTVLSIDIRRMELADLNRRLPAEAGMPLPKSVPLRHREAPPPPRPSPHTITLQAPAFRNLRLPKRLRVIYFLARTRLAQRIIMVGTVIWIGILVYTDPAGLRTYLAAQDIECLAKDGMLLASCCLAGQIRVWDAQTGDCLTVIPNNGAESCTTSKPVNEYEVRRRPTRPALFVDQPDLTALIDTNFSELPASHASSNCGFNFGGLVEKAYKEHEATPQSVPMSSPLPPTPPTPPAPPIDRMSVPTGDWESSVWSMELRGNLIAAGRSNGKLEVYRLEDSCCLFTLQGHSGGITAIYIDQTMVLASGGQDGAICLWDVLTGSRVSHVYGHRGDVTSLVCTTSCVISSGLDDLICIWDRSTGIKLYSIQQEVGCGASLAVISESLLVTGGNGCVSFWDLNYGDLLQTVYLGQNSEGQHVRQLLVLENAAIVCDFGSELSLVYVPSVLEKLD
ncbi:Sterol regulatory element-binding protein cleavage-activating protein [Bagarius yarrelli]|uniref:Sterol regulatory element-binding protein cleavage-activating protein n=1 Tax=Bagarius yarrelli TaxID=175774 RepID=A0A556TLP6_BAGYA|nr:Sterol regulatory element-binding protein cleavage-activating protein [Bagarius yarrelli]